jgi:molybdate transport system substrate-binding protein
MTILSFAPSQAAVKYVKKPVVLTIFAAASLNVVFVALGKIFEKSHPGTVFRFSFLASSNLATQLAAGAPADVFASASPVDMKMARSRVPKSYYFAANHVVLGISRKNPLGIKTLQDLNNPKVKWIQCAHQVPCGMAADAALAAEGTVKSKPVSLEPKVTSAVTKLLVGEVDAAIIYHSDVMQHRNVLKEVVFRSRTATFTEYPIGVVSRSSHLALANAFVALVRSPQGVELLTHAGFDRTK